MPYTTVPFSVEIKDPVHGYIGLTELEEAILNLRLTQRLRMIKTPAGVYQVYPGADTSLLGRMLGFMHITWIMLDHLGADLDEILRARLAAMFLTLGQGTWSNVMDEYLAQRGLDRQKMAQLAVTNSEATEIVEQSSFSRDELVKDLVQGIPLKGVRINLLNTPVNPGLVDMLERDAYFAGVEYAQLEYRRLFDSTRIAKNKVAVERGSLYTLESYLSAAANMFDAVYYHKTVRAAELMLLRILDEAGSRLFAFPAEDPSEFFSIDDLTFSDSLTRLAQDAPEELRRANRIFDAFRWRNLIKLASSRTIFDVDFLKRLEQPDGLYQIETQIAEAAGIDPGQVYVDHPARASVTFWPGRFALDDLVMFERGSKGYEFWRADDLSLIARSIGRKMMTVRIYTTKGYRTKVRKEGDSLLESVDGVGEIA